MTRTFAGAADWSTTGTELFIGAVGGLAEEDFDHPTPLPGWTRRHLVGHVAANAEALGNLVHWAATGVKTPMYASPQERAAGIEKAATMPGEQLRTWLDESADRLAAAMNRLTTEQWRREVATAQGRTVPATELPWMRAREVCVHAVDLDTGIAFADLAEGFLRALREEIRAKRGLESLPEGDLAEITAWLAGRPHTLPGAYDLGPWL